MEESDIATQILNTLSDHSICTVAFSAIVATMVRWAALPVHADSLPERHLVHPAHPQPCRLHVGPLGHRHVRRPSSSAQHPLNASRFVAVILGMAFAGAESNPVVGCPSVVSA